MSCDQMFSLLLVSNITHKIREYTLNIYILDKEKTVNTGTLYKISQPQEKSGDNELEIRRSRFWSIFQNVNPPCS